MRWVLVGPVTVGAPGARDGASEEGMPKLGFEG